MENLTEIQKVKKCHKRHLNASIYYSRHLKWYVINIDGDLFYEKTYKKACQTLVQIINRDEICLNFLSSDVKTQQ